MVESFDDIGKNMNWQLNSLLPEKKQIPLLPELNEDEQLILHALTGQTLHIDQLMNQIHTTATLNTQHTRARTKRCN